MKRVVLRIGCGAVCTALALTLGCGCTLLPPATGVPGAASSAVSVPTDDSGKPLYDPAVLNDSRLRVLYCDSRSGSSTTILCGSTPLHQSARSENVSLVEDSATGTADYWLRSWSDPTGRGGRRTALYDKTGTEVMSFEGEQNATLQNGLLVLQESRLVDGGYVPESGYGPVRSSTLPPAQRCRCRRAHTAAPYAAISWCSAATPARKGWTITTGIWITNRTAG